jgi:hypothetical protein
MTGKVWKQLLRKSISIINGYLSFPISYISLKNRTKVIIEKVKRNKIKERKVTK